MSHREQVLHAYRRILRATTYVPDSFARAYVQDFIASRFKAHGLFHPAQPNATAVLANRLKRTRRWTRVLESAADGNLEDLNNVLLRVHGRQGARKRVLIGQLLQPDEDLLPKDDKALEELMQNPPIESKLAFTKGTKLEALATSQQQHNPKTHIKAKLRRLDPRIPEENQWGRPMPRKLAQSLTKKWWAATIDKLLPPVPRSEWDRLRDLAIGAIPLEEAPARRPRGTILPANQVDKPMDGEVLLNALRSTARPTRVGVQKLEFDALQGLKIVDVNSTQRELARTSSRAKRRVYAGIWTLSPTMTQEEKTIKNRVGKQWVVEWGGNKSKFTNGVVSKPTIRDQELFEGIDGYSDDSDKIALKFLRERSAAKVERKRVREEQAAAESLDKQALRSLAREKNAETGPQQRAF